MISSSGQGRIFNYETVMTEPTDKSAKLPGKSNSIANEWPTWMVIIVVYGSWGWMLVHFQDLNLLIAVPILTLILTLHSSLAHEIIHGHPTSNQTINNLIGYLPLGLIYPYTIFKETHLQHHNNQFITYPGVDPESFFHTRSNWESKNRVLRIIAWVNMTLLGRLLLGPGTSFIALVKWAIRDVLHAKFTRKAMWVIHYTLTILIVYAAQEIFNIPALLYILMGYFSLSIIQLRSFYEHQPVFETNARSVIQESSLLFRLLFLHNNYHYTHHANPSMPWHLLKKEYFDNRQKYLDENSGFQYDGYWRWLKYLIRPVHSPVHPFYEKD